MVTMFYFGSLDGVEHSILSGVRVRGKEGWTEDEETKKEKVVNLHTQTNQKKM